jgi:hypothetical protein
MVVSSLLGGEPPASTNFRKALLAIYLPRIGCIGPCRSLPCTVTIKISFRVSGDLHVPQDLILSLLATFCRLFAQRLCTGKQLQITIAPFGSAKRIQYIQWGIMATSRMFASRLPRSTSVSLYTRTGAERVWHPIAVRQPSDLIFIRFMLVPTGASNTF